MTSLALGLVQCHEFRHVCGLFRKGVFFFLFRIMNIKKQKGRY